MRNYDLILPGAASFSIRGDALPEGLVAPDTFIWLRTTKRKSRPVGPNYDGTWNSIQAAMQYESVRSNVRWQILKYMLKNNGAWISGRFLSDTFGTEALRRVREIREDFGWPVEERSIGRGVWEYRLDVRPPRNGTLSRRGVPSPNGGIQRRRIIPRRPPSDAED